MTHSSGNECTSSRAADFGFGRLAATDTEDAGAAAATATEAEAEADGFATTSRFLFSCGLSRESSTVASRREKTGTELVHHTV